MIVWEISLGSLLTICTILFAGLGFYFQTLYDSKTFRVDISEIKTDLRVLNKVIADLAVQTSRLDNQADRLNRLDVRIDELRHGKGFVS
jgi:hypothetical protein